MKPQIGDMVDYEGMGKTYAAVVTEVKEEGRLALCVFKESSTQFLPMVYHSANKEPGCWTPRAQHFSIPIDKDFGVAQVNIKNKKGPAKKKK